MLKMWLSLRGLLESKGTEYLQTVWKWLDSVEVSPLRQEAIKQTAFLPLAPPPAPAEKSSGADAITPAPACKEDILTTPGIAEIAGANANYTAQQLEGTQGTDVQQAAPK